MPKAITSEMIKNNDVIVITGENVVYYNNTVTTLKELENKFLQSTTKPQQLLIKANRRTSVGRIADIWDICRKTGIEYINIATNQDN